MSLNLDPSGVPQPPTGTTDTTFQNTGTTGTTDTSEVGTFGDISQDTLLKELGATVQTLGLNPTGTSYNANASVPDLPPSDPAAAQNAWELPTQLPTSPTDPAFAMVSNFFIPPGGTFADGEAAYQGFLTEYPPTTAEYQAVLTTAFPDFSHPEAFPAAMQTVLGLQGHLAEFMAIGQNNYSSSSSSDKNDEASSTSSSGDGANVSSDNGQESFLVVNPPVTSRYQGDSSDQGQSGNQGQQSGDGSTSSSTGTLGTANSSFTTGTSGTTSTNLGADSTSSSQKTGNVVTSDLPDNSPPGTQTLLNTSATILAINNATPSTTVGVPTALAQLDTVTAQVNKDLIILNNLPPSPEKTVLLNYLKSISAAIIKFSELLYNLQSIDSTQAKDSSQASLQTSLDKIEEQRVAAHKQLRAAHKAHKKSKLGIFGKILKIIGIICLLVVAAYLMTQPGMGQLIGTLLIMQATDMIMSMNGKKDGVWSHVFEAVDSIATAIGKSMGLSKHQIENLQDAFKICMIVVVASAVLVSGSFLFGGTQVVQSCLEDSGVIKDKTALMVINMCLSVATAVAQIAVSIILMIPPMTGIGIGLMTAVIGKLAETVGETTMAVANIVVNIVSILADIVQSSMSAVSDVNTIMLAQIQMQLDKQMGKLEKDIALKQMLIDMLKTVIKKLQEALNDLSGAISGAGQLSQSMFAHASQSAGQIFSGSIAV